MSRQVKIICESGQAHDCKIVWADTGEEIGLPIMAVSISIDPNQFNQATVVLEAVAVEGKFEPEWIQWPTLTNINEGVD